MLSTERKSHAVLFDLAQGHPESRRMPLAVVIVTHYVLLGPWWIATDMLLCLKTRERKKKSSVFFLFF